MSTELFGVNVRGPDDIIATRDYPEAVELAQYLNGFFARHVSTKHHEYDPLLWAIPGVWQGTPEMHTDDLATPSSDYANALDTVRSLTALQSQEARRQDMSGALIERLRERADTDERVYYRDGALLREAAAALYLLRNDRDNAIDGADEAETRAPALSVEQEPVTDAKLLEIAADLRRDFEDVRMWSGSAFIAGEKVSDPDGDRSELYRWLCHVGNHLEYYASAVDDAASVLSTAIRERDEARAEIGRIGPLAAAYDYLESPAGREIAEARIAELEKALEPSADTKAAYIGEFGFDVAIWDNEAGEDGEGAEIMQRTLVPWTTIKEIMAAIRARATLTGGKQ